jgi:hypothetical protein
VQDCRFYDRTDIVKETIDTLKAALLEEAIMASAGHHHLSCCTAQHALRLVTLPLSLALAFVLMCFGVDSNIMSLAGWPLPIGDVADMGIIMTENIYRHIASASGEKLTSRSFRRRERSRRADHHGGTRTRSFLSSRFSSSSDRKGNSSAAGVHEDICHRRIGDSGNHRRPLMCYFLFRPVKWSKRRRGWCWSHRRARHVRHARGARVVHQSRSLQRLADVVVVGVIVAPRRGADDTERFLPLEENASRNGSRPFTRPSLRWVSEPQEDFHDRAARDSLHRHFSLARHRHTLKPLVVS